MSEQDLVQILEYFRPFTSQEIVHIILDNQEIQAFDDLEVLCSLTSQTELLLPHLVLLKTMGSISHNIYKRLNAKDFLMILSCQRSSLEILHICMDLCFEVFQIVECSIYDLQILDHDRLVNIVVLIGDAYSSNTEFATSILYFIFAFHGQMMKKNGWNHFILNVLLDSKLKSIRKEISMSIGYVYNRIDNAEQQAAFINILFGLYSDSNYFYTNDSCVIFDITLRQVMRLENRSEATRVSMIELLPLILKSIPVDAPCGGHIQKKEQLIRLLKGIVESFLTTPLICHTAKKVLHSVSSQAETTNVQFNRSKRMV